MLTLEERRNVVASIDYLKSGGGSLYAESLEYDAVGLLTGRVDVLDGAPINQEYSYNARGELVAANNTHAANEAWQYDNIGNRTHASEVQEPRVYESNEVNQYTGVTYPWKSFVPQWDCAGNQTRLQTNTGDWVVEYDAESRPTLFSGRRINLSHSSV